MTTNSDAYVTSVCKPTHVSCLETMQKLSTGVMHQWVGTEGYTSYRINKQA